jgi:hypothetical protein
MAGIRPFWILLLLEYCERNLEASVRPDSLWIASKEVPVVLLEALISEVILHFTQLHNGEIYKLACAGHVLLEGRSTNQLFAQDP